MPGLEPDDVLRTLREFMAFLHQTVSVQFIKQRLFLD